MLIRYKKDYEKIAMGLLSFMPKEKNLKNLQSTIKKYEMLDEWKLFLWKEEDIVGIVGICVKDENQINVQHICVSPSHRCQGIGKNMIKSLKDQHHNYAFIATEDTVMFFEKCLCTTEDE